MILNGFLTQFKNKSFSFVRFGFLFFLFFNVLIFSNPSPGQRLKQVIGHYDCTSNSQCHENQYCDIDSHVCVDKNPEPACNADLCDLDEICPVTEPPIVETCPLPDTCAADEYFSFAQKKCIKRPTNCNYILDDTCVECVTNADCTGKQCDSETHTCEDYTTCNPTSGKVLVDGKCACRGNMTENEFGVCTCVNIPEGGNSDTCDCDDDKVIVQGKCMPICDTSIPGITGERDAEGNCLCKTSAHYLEKAVMNADNTYYCECNHVGVSKGDLEGYYNDPNGKCVRCYQDDGKYYENYSDVVPASVDTTVWKCPISSSERTVYGWDWPKYYNPSTGEWCELMQRLRLDRGKSDGSFVCEYCDDLAQVPEFENGTGWKYINKNNISTLSRTSLSNGSCSCYQNNDYNEAKYGDKYCHIPSECFGKVMYPDGKCLDCGLYNHQMRTDTDKCIRYSEETKNKYCWNGIYPNGATIGSGYFSYNAWMINKDPKCTSYGVSLDENSPCSYKYGCSIYTTYTTLPCKYNTLINSSSCVCDTGASKGYCCAPNAYATANGCVTCPAGEVVNAAKNGCEKCPVNQISMDGECQNCGENQYPNTAQTMCKQCKGGKVLNNGGTGCVCPAGTTEDPLTNTCA